MRKSTVHQCRTITVRSRRSRLHMCVCSLLVNYCFTPTKTVDISKRFNGSAGNAGFLGLHINHVIRGENKYEQVSAVADEPCDALCLGQRVVNKGERSVWKTCNGRTELTTSATVDVPWRKCRKTGKVQSLGQSSRGQYPYLWRYPNWLEAKCRVSWGLPLCQKTSLISSTVLTQYWRTGVWPDRRPDSDRGRYRDSIADTEGIWFHCVVSYNYIMKYLTDISETGRSYLSIKILSTCFRFNSIETCAFESLSAARVVSISFQTRLHVRVK